MNRLITKTEFGEYEMNQPIERGNAVGTKEIYKKLYEYEQAELEGRLVMLPELKRDKILYWVWTDKIVRFKYKGVYVGSMTDAKFRVMCKMELLEDVTINKRLIQKGDKRYFYADELDAKGIYTTRKDAEMHRSI